MIRTGSKRASFSGVKLVTSWYPHLSLVCCLLLGIWACGSESTNPNQALTGFAPTTADDQFDEQNDSVGPIAAQGTVSRLPNLSDLMISEIMYDPASGLEDAHAEWIEIQSLTNDPLTLDDCYLTDIAHVDEKRSQADLSGIELTGYGTVLAARSYDMNNNGGLRADAVFSFGLGNGGDTVILGCADIVLDQVDFDAGSQFPVAKGRSIQRAENRWCPGSTIYHEPTGQLGSPGERNPICGQPAANVCWTHLDCRQGLRCIDDTCAEESMCEVDGDCGAGFSCDRGQCEPVTVEVEQLAAGMVVISEFLYDPIGELSDRKAEWIELKNTTDDTLMLSGCYIADSGSGAQWAALDEVTIDGGGFGLIVRSESPTENGGLLPNETFRFNLNNTGDEVRFICGDDVLDSVTYGTSDFSASGASLARSGPVEGLANQLGVNWCVGSTPYFDAPLHYGTPGLPNPPCP